jgi:hypothetical protein
MGLDFPSRWLWKHSHAANGNPFDKVDFLTLACACPNSRSFTARGRRRKLPKLLDLGSLESWRASEQIEKKELADPILRSLVVYPQPLVVEKTWRQIASNCDVILALVSTINLRRFYEHCSCPSAGSEAL